LIVADIALERKKQPLRSSQRIIDGDVEARLIAIACGTLPAACALGGYDSSLTAWIKDTREYGR
jgi:hypothetical protein